MILDRYFARRFIQSFLMIGAVFLSLIMLIDLIEQLRKFEGQDVSFGQLFRLMLLNAPAAVNEILPLLMILSTIVLYVGLARSSELVVTRATGRSGIRALLGPVLVALIIGVLAVSTLNPIVAATSNRYQQLADTYRTGGPSALSLSGEGLWLRQGAARGQSVIHATGYGGGEEDVVLFDVSILTYAAGGGPVRRIHAKSAELQQDEWILKQAKVWPLVTGLNPETSAAYHDTLRIPTTLTEDRIRDSLGRPTGISIYDLPDTIRQLKQAGFSTKRHEVWLQVELARPVFLMAMVLVGAAFTMRHTRFGGTGVAVLTAVLLGFGLYFIRNFAQILGENGQLPVVFAAWGPPVASILLTFGLLLHAEDG
ncbi:LPS export ABC transporter permease LptG [Sedimentitalea nanhaiensis]|uniref:Lipopolysaccharide export system permease protein n=1 Tax=Sedimentitalea nanhaiensis TaxID=999627 RepID=A0A1I7AP47_9RHOB|nr:LPS export ABC transporter permease LptG [Sedimentitalea nanhaiensis]SFT76666.1 lipopolysaccharide export system permease protein [Sedimentitalea nanhaiensis]